MARLASILSATLLFGAPALSLVLTCTGNAAAQQTPPDVVTLKNGGVLRGTISEMNPKTTVTIVTLTGEKRIVNMSDVAYAGPAALLPGATPPATGGPRPLIQLNARDAALHLRSSQPEITFHLRITESTGSAVGVGAGIGGRSAIGIGGVTQYSGRSYARICTAPCDATMPAGQYNLALSRGGGSPVETDGMIGFEGPATLQGRYTSYAALRVAGVVVTIAAVLTGGYLAITSFHACPDTDPNCDNTNRVDQSRLIAGLGIFIGGAIVGSIMSSKSDESDIVVLPATVGGFSVPRAAVASERRNDAPLPGVTVSARF